MYKQLPAASRHSRTKNPTIPIMIFMAVLLPWDDTGAAVAGGMTVPTGAGAAGWVAPHLLQNLAPSASGFPQLTQNVAIYNPPSKGECYEGAKRPSRGIRKAVFSFKFLILRCLQ